MNTRSIEDRSVVGSLSVVRYLLLLLLVITAGCRSSAAPATTTTVVPPTMTTMAPITVTTDPFAVPAVIDLAYVQRVLETIYHLDGEATRRVYAKRVPDAEFYERLEAIYGGPRLAESKRVLGENAAEGFVRFANPPGDPAVRAVEIVQATSRCLIVRADLDYGPHYKVQGKAQPQAVIQLSRADIVPFNPTGWGVIGAGTPLTNQDLRICP